MATHRLLARIRVGLVSAHVDVLDVTSDTSDTSSVEKEADDAAREALVPAAEWDQSAGKYVAAPATVSQLASRIGVADAVVAGRVRFERRNFRLLSGMVGVRQVRRHFPDVKWSADDD